MGQAKLRGSREQRIANAIAKVEALRPKFLICNQCKGEITEIQTMDTRGVPGLDAAFAGICPTCNTPTFAMSGEPEAVAMMSEVMRESMGEPLEGKQVLPLKD